MGSEHQGHSLTVSPPWLPVRKFSGQCVTINYNKPAVLLQCFSATLSNRVYFFPVPLFVAFEIKRCNLDTSSRQIITHLQGHFFCHLCLNPSEDKPLRSAAVLSGLCIIRGHSQCDHSREATCSQTALHLFKPHLGTTGKVVSKADGDVDSDRLWTLLQGEEPQ